MTIHTFTEFIWDDDSQSYVRLLDCCYDYQGPVAECKGPSQEQKDLAKSQSAMYDTMTSNYKTLFGQDQNILNSLTASLQPILNKGPNQFGFSDDELNDLNSTAIQNTGQQYHNAAKALGEQLAANGGDAFIPAGNKTQMKEELAGSAADQASNQLLGIKKAGYDAGNRNYLTAVGGLESTAGLTNPIATGSSATSAGDAAYSSAKSNQEMANAGSIWNTVGGLIGGAAGSFMGPFGASLGKQAGSSVGSLLGGGGGGDPELAAL